MVTGIAVNVFTLVKLVLIHLLFHGLSDALHALVGVVHDVGVCHILCVYARPTLYHGQLLCVQVLIGIRSKTASHWFLLVLLIVAAGSEVRQLLLCLSKLLVVLLLVGVYAFYLVGASYFNFSAVATHVVGVFAVLG